MYMYTIIHPQKWRCVMVESIACLLTETGERRFGSQRGQEVFFNDVSWQIMLLILLIYELRLQ